MNKTSVWGPVVDDRGEQRIGAMRSVENFGTVIVLYDMTDKLFYLYHATEGVVAACKDRREATRLCVAYSVMEAIVVIDREQALELLELAQSWARRHVDEMMKEHGITDDE